MDDVSRPNPEARPSAMSVRAQIDLILLAPATDESLKAGLSQFFRPPKHGFGTDDPKTTETAQSHALVRANSVTTELQHYDDFSSMLEIGRRNRSSTLTSEDTLHSLSCQLPRRAVGYRGRHPKGYSGQTALTPDTHEDGWTQILMPNGSDAPRAVHKAVV